jgi:hypothetical protein
LTHTRRKTMGAEDAASKDLSLDEEQSDEVSGGVMRAKRVAEQKEVEALAVERRRAVAE